MPKVNFDKLKSEFKRHKFLYILLVSILLGGLFLRVYRTDSVLGFYFDQGRDAQVIWDFWHNRKIFLLGPTTGIAGIFRGPFYYYLIAPLYLVGGGDPVYPAVFLAITSVVAIGVLYFLAAKMQDRQTGILVATLASFSFYIITASRWLSNPTPMLLLSTILLWSMFLIIDGKSKAWYLLTCIAGISLFHFGSSGEFFYFPAILVFAIWQRATLNKKIIFVSALIFLATASPLLVFDLRHGGILSNNIKNFLFGQGSFKSSFWEVLPIRLNFFYDTFTSKIFHWRRDGEVLILLMTALSFFVLLPKFVKNKYVMALILLLLSPIIGLIFFQGNFGNIYDYYLTGYYLLFILLFALVLGLLWKYKLGKIFVIVTLFFFLRLNLEVSLSRVSDNADGPETIIFRNQKQAVDWIYSDAAGQEFNLDVYVPPVIPYAYDYLFTWIGTSKYGYVPKESQIEVLYTLYEQDPPHPERLDAWLQRQEGIGVVEKEARFGGITVQKRMRISDGTN